MRVLLLHPEDSPSRGPWSQQHWDLVIDLGNSSLFTEHRWAQFCDCTVLRAQSFREGLSDVKRVRELFLAGRHRLLDEGGIDWWDLMSLLIAPAAVSQIVLQRIASQIPAGAEIWATKAGDLSRMLGFMLGRPVSSFHRRCLASSSARAFHYLKLVQRFSPAELKQIILDKYDSAYRWRARFAPRPAASGQPVVLLPSAYENVSRMAYAYARMLPSQSFLMVATRQSAQKCLPPENVLVRDLAGYVTMDAATEVPSLIHRWETLREDLKAYPELRVLIAAGIMDPFPAWIRNGLVARNAWREVLSREPVQGVLCGDDSNLYTRLPVLLAAKRRIPTIDFHHGAMDGRYLLKELPSDWYLAKNEMERDYLLRICGLPSERVVLGAPSLSESHGSDGTEEAQRSSAIFFSEPYDVGGMRAEEVYREVLPALCEIARANGRSVIVKLHPFESRSERARLLRDVLSSEDAELVTVVDGPLTADLLAKAWFGITVESTTVLDCLRNGICCFLCTWLAYGHFEYVQQYARFGVGEPLETARQIDEIPRRLEALRNMSSRDETLPHPVDPDMLQAWLTDAELSGLRSAS
jgi:hypothetical protein